MRYRSRDVRLRCVDQCDRPLTITLPDAGKRFVSKQVISEDLYVVEVFYGPGADSYDQARVGTRYVYLIIRTLVDPEKSNDVAAAHRAAAISDSGRI